MRYAGTFSRLILIGLALAIPSRSAGADLEAGRKIFKTHCQVCHGEKGDGKTFVADALNPPPRNFTSEKSKQKLTRQRMIRSVTDGRPQTAMMPWKDNLTPEEIRAVVAFIREKFMGLVD